MPLRSEIQKHSGTLSLFAVVLILLAAGFFRVKDAPPIADEPVHYGQIMDILSGTNLLPKVCRQGSLLHKSQQFGCSAVYDWDASLLLLAMWLLRPCDKDNQE